jgi:hypothetical protein
MEIITEIFQFLGNRDFAIAFWSGILYSLVVAGIIYLLANWFTDIFKAPIKVLVHEAFLGNSTEPMYFVKVTNLSTKSIFTITHIYVKDKKNDLDLLNIDRPLPYKLSASKQWETWFAKSKIIDNKRIFKNVRIVLSNGKTYKSNKNSKVRPIGFVA